VRVHPGKKAIRALGVAESFSRADKFSCLAGVVMRSDLVVDGFVFGRARVGGNDATSAVARMCRRLRREDVNVLLLSGAIISYYNVVDVDDLSGRTGLPVVCLTYRSSSGVAESLRRRFTDWEQKLALYEKLGARTTLELKTGKRVYVRLAGIGEDDARRVVDVFTLQGSYAEPVRVARLLARAGHDNHPPT
jgi:endonuclease V-like protein UPF0215 family